MQSNKPLTSPSVFEFGTSRSNGRNATLVHTLVMLCQEFSSSRSV